VNEASCVIQEAAHEDANIIFGAVIDPHLVGKLKITVIATGFERAGATRRKIPSAALATPTDLTNYTTHIARATEPGTVPSVPAAQPAAFAASEAVARVEREVAMRDVAPPAFTVTRRPALELTLPLSAGEAARGGPASDASGFDLSSPLDIPAFLRRQN
jgi:cell division protein FtsZ